MKGWIEILQIQTILPINFDIEDLSTDMYKMAGSTLPLEEYSNPFQVYDQYAKIKVDTLSGGGRPLRVFDIINVCAKDMQKICTMVLVPKHTAVAMQDDEDRCVQYTTTLPLALVLRSTSFPSFVRPQFGA